MKKKLQKDELPLDESSEDTLLDPETEMDVEEISDEDEEDDDVDMDSDF